MQVEKNQLYIECWQKYVKLTIYDNVPLELCHLWTSWKSKLLIMWSVILSIWYFAKGIIGGCADKSKLVCDMGIDVLR